MKTFPALHASVGMFVRVIDSRDPDDGRMGFPTGQFSLGDAQREKEMFAVWEEQVQPARAEKV